jgi:hypothetical protein
MLTPPFRTSSFSPSPQVAFSRVSYVTRPHSSLPSESQPKPLPPFASAPHQQLTEMALDKGLLDCFGSAIIDHFSRLRLPNRFSLQQTTRKPPPCFDSLSSPSISYGQHHPLIAKPILLRDQRLLRLSHRHAHPLRHLSERDDVIPPQPGVAPGVPSPPEVVPAVVSHVDRILGGHAQLLARVQEDGRVGLLRLDLQGSGISNVKAKKWTF